MFQIPLLGEIALIIVASIFGFAMGMTFTHDGDKEATPNNVVRKEK